MKIKRWDTGTSTWIEDAPDVYIANIVASGTPSSSNFLRGDGSWQPVTDTNNYLTGVSGSGNGTATFTRLGLSNLTWTTTHTHAATDITSGVLPTSRGGTGTVSNAVQGGVIYGSTTTTYASTAAGTSGLSQYLLSNGTSAPTFTSIFYCRVLTSDVSSGSTTGVSVFDISLPIGTYHFESVGHLSKAGTSSKAYQVLFTFDSTTGVTYICANVVFSPNTNVAANTGTAMSSLNSTRIQVPSSNTTTPVSNSYFQGTTNTSVISNMPYNVSGIFTITSARNFRMHIRNTVTVAGNTVSVGIGSYMKITRVG
jgi:hypothetical protein